MNIEHICESLSLKVNYHFNRCALLWHISQLEVNISRLGTQCFCIAYIFFLQLLVFFKFESKLLVRISTDRSLEQQPVWSNEVPLWAQSLFKHLWLWNKWTKCSRLFIRHDTDIQENRANSLRILAFICFVSPASIAKPLDLCYFNISLQESPDLS